MPDGSQKERDFIELLEQDLNFVAMRAPASGGATDRALPDVLAGRPDGGVKPDEARSSEVWAFEAKYSTRESYYIPLEDVEHLQEFAGKFGANRRFAFRWSGNESFSRGDTTWYLVEPSELPLTETKAKVEYEHIKDVGVPALDLLAP